MLHKFVGGLREIQVAMSVKVLSAGAGTDSLRSSSEDSQDESLLAVGVSGLDLVVI